MTCEIGLIGLAVMGQNLALNIAEKGFKIAVYNRTASKVDDCVVRAKNEGNLPLEGHKDLKQFIAAIKIPRKMIILVKAGDAVDKIIDDLVPLLSKGDMVIDGGNEWYEFTERRSIKMSSLGFHYMGMGVSGGEEGARHGPALMPGGSREGYDMIKHIVQKVAAQVDGSACVSYIGAGGAGNYVKMVHNGIEYGDMELIAESYDLLRKVAGLNNEQLQKIFSDWNKGELQSYLIEITADIFMQKDQKSAGSLVDCILDVAGSKGTGMWTVQEAARRGVPCPTIQAALDMRYMSTFKSDRVAASAVYPKAATTTSTVAAMADDIRDALYCSKICSYAQGMMLLKKASDDCKWDLSLGEIAKGWKGGCIIRAKFLDRIREAYVKNPNLPSLLMDSKFMEEIKSRLVGWRRVVSTAQLSGIAVPALSASLAYFDAYTTSSLPINLVQAQRDYFGAHTYQRTDEDASASFHTNWGKSNLV